MNNKIGNALKVLRNRAGLSQFQLELKAGLSTSTITRIENGQINPTKETLAKLAAILNLNQYESMYLMGLTVEPASEIEIAEAYSNIEDKFENTNILAYMIDERWRAIKSSNKFFHFLGISSQEFEEKIKYKTIIEIIIDKNLPVRQFVDPAHFEEILKSQLPRYYEEASFMQDDPTCIRTINIINSDPVASNIWKQITDLGKDFEEEFTRTVTFKLGPISIPLIYSREPLMKHSRFEVVEYIPTNKFIRYLASKI